MLEQPQKLPVLADGTCRLPPTDHAVNIDSSTMVSCHYDILRWHIKPGWMLPDLHYKYATRILWPAWSTVETRVDFLTWAYTDSWPPRLKRRIHLLKLITELMVQHTDPELAKFQPRWSLPQGGTNDLSLRNDVLYFGKDFNTRSSQPLYHVEINPDQLYVHEFSLENPSPPRKRFVIRLSDEAKAWLGLDVMPFDRIEVTSSRIYVHYIPLDVSILSDSSYRTSIKSSSVFEWVKLDDILLLAYMHLLQVLAKKPWLGLLLLNKLS
jgi:hypothetical protein